MMKSLQQQSVVDRLIYHADQGIRTVFAGSPTCSRQNPAHAMPDVPMTAEECRHVAGLMRVNHAGEISAQALYSAQALTARTSVVREKMHQSALEENDHLAWCADRLGELGSHTSRLNAVWYLGSFTIGLLAGLVGDKWSLGFVVETERQVVRHLQAHLRALPGQDDKSRVILQQMEQDELHHATVALESGGAPLPGAIKSLMMSTAKIMTSTAYWI